MEFLGIASFHDGAVLMHLMDPRFREDERYYYFFCSTGAASSNPQTFRANA